MQYLEFKSDWCHPDSNISELGQWRINWKKNWSREENKSKLTHLQVSISTTRFRWHNLRRVLAQQPRREGESAEEDFEKDEQKGRFEVRTGLEGETGQLGGHGDERDVAHQHPRTPRWRCETARICPKYWR